MKLLLALTQQGSGDSKRNNSVCPQVPNNRLVGKTRAQIVMIPCGQGHPSRQFPSTVERSLGNYL